jgi:hypothetical protein
MDTASNPSDVRSTCRDSVISALLGLAERTSRDVFTGGQVYTEMLSKGANYSKSTVLKTMQRMKEPPDRAPYIRLVRDGRSGFRLEQAADRRK